MSFQLTDLATESRNRFLPFHPATSPATSLFVASVGLPRMSAAPNSIPVIRSGVAFRDSFSPLPNARLH